MVITWSIGTIPDAELVNTMLDAAIETVADGNERPVVHSDSKNTAVRHSWVGLTCTATGPS